jgi:dienelactone hydrolase
MIRERVDYKCGEKKLKGYLVYNEIVGERRPCIVIAHAWRGLEAFEQEKADLLAKAGYVAFCADLYGGGKTAANDEEASNLMLPLFKDRALLRERIGAAIDFVKTLPSVDNKQIGAIGFCFGGLAVLELLRSGKEVKGVVSFHGLLGDTLGEEQANSLPSAPTKAKALILHGYKDPMVSQEEIRNMEETFTSLGIDWQMTIYGSAYHAFTHPGSKNPSSGLCYDPICAKRAWKSMQNFFQEIFHL